MAVSRMAKKASTARQAAAPPDAYWMRSRGNPRRRAVWRAPLGHQKTMLPLERECESRAQIVACVRSRKRRMARLHPKEAEEASTRWAT
eukprot:912642-Prymnesium_polylepis.1